MKKSIKRIFAVVLAMAICLAIMPVTFAASCRGDVDGDGRTNSGDALLILRHVVGYTIDNFDYYRADLNNDGSLNASDALRVLQIAVGLDDPTTYSKNEVIKFYSDALDSVAMKDITVLYESRYNSRMVNDDDPSESWVFDESNEMLEDTFVDGYDDVGYSIYEFCPAANIDPSLVESATITWDDDGYYFVEITLVEDYADYDDYVPYTTYPYLLNYADCTISGFENYFTYDGTAYFPGSKITAIIVEGELSSLTIEIPFELHMNLEHYEEYWYFDVTEVGTVMDVYTFCD